MVQQRHNQQDDHENRGLPLSLFACPNPNCADFNRFNAGNLSAAERMGKDKAIRRLYCKNCGTRFSQGRSSLIEYTYLPTDTFVRTVKHLGRDCSVEAAPDILEVEPRTVEDLLERARKRAAHFHRLQREQLERRREVVQLTTCSHAKELAKKGQKAPSSDLLAGIVRRIARGLARHWML